MINVILTFVAHDGRISRMVNMPIDEKGDEYLTRLEILADTDPVVSLPFANHGTGYHTICRQWDSEIDQLPLF